MFGYEKIARDIGNARGTREYFSLPLKPIYPRGYLRITEHSNIPFISMTYFRTLPEHYTFTPNITRNTTYWYVLTQATIYANGQVVHIKVAVIYSKDPIVHLNVIWQKLKRFHPRPKLQ